MKYLNMKMFLSNNPHIIVFKAFSIQENSQFNFFCCNVHDQGKMYKMYKNSNNRAVSFLKLIEWTFNPTFNRFRFYVP